MSIQAISSVRNNSNVNFEGRVKKEKAEKAVTSPVASSMKAVPLVVLLAMSPMTTTNAQQIMRSNANTVELAQIQPDVTTTVLETKTFKTNRGDLKLKLINYRFKNNSSSNQLTYELYSSDGKKYSGSYKDRVQMEYRLYDDSGLRFGEITASERVFGYNIGEDNVHIEDENVEQYIKSLEEKKLIGTSDFSAYDNYNHSTEDGGYVSSWYSQAKYEPEKFGTISRPANFKTETGNYELRLYENDGKSTLTIKRDNGPELKLKGLKLTDYNFTLCGKQNVQLKLGKILVEYKGEEHFLVDNDMFLFIAQTIMNDPASKSILPDIEEENENVVFKVPDLDFIKENMWLIGL